MERNYLQVTRAVILAVLVALLTGCGGSGGGSTTPPPVVSVSVSPTTATLLVGATEQFIATVTGTTNTAVSWTVSSISPPAGADIGSIDSTGNYSAPLWASIQLTVNVVATSAADPTKSASATVTVAVPTHAVLLWSNTLTNVSPSILSLRSVIADADSNLIAGGSFINESASTYYSFVTSYSAKGILRWSFDNNKETNSSVMGGLVLQDGSSLWAGVTEPASTPMSMLLGVTDTGQKLLENTCPGFNGFTSIAAAPNQMYTGSGSTVIVGDIAGNIDCSNNIVVTSDASAQINSVWVRPDGTYLLAAGTFYSKPAGANFNTATFVAKLDLATKQVVWEADFQDVLNPTVIGVDENGLDVVYVNAVMFSGNGNLYEYTIKLNASGAQVAGWPQTYPQPIQTTSGFYGGGGIVPNPAGGVVAVGGLCTFTAYNPDGTVRWDLQQSFPGTHVVGICEDAVASNGKFLYAVGAIVAGYPNQTMQAALVEALALPPQ